MTLLHVCPIFLFSYDCDFWTNCLTLLLQRVYIYGYQARHRGGGKITKCVRQPSSPRGIYDLRHNVTEEENKRGYFRLNEVN